MPKPSTRQRALSPVLLAMPGTLWILLFFFLPLLFILGISFLSRGTYGQVELPATIENYKRFFGWGLFGFDPLYPRIIGRSLALGFLTTLLCLLAGLPLAFFIAGLSPRFKSAALTLVIIPLWTNLLIRTYGWQILLAPGSWVSHAATVLGLLPPMEGIYPGLLAVGLGMLCDFLPFFTLPLYVSVEKIDWTLAEAAMDLGAGRWSVLRHAVLPQIKPGMMTGALLVFIPATGQFVIPDLLGGAKVTLVGNLIQQQFGPSRDWPFGSAIALCTMTLVLAGLWIYARSANRESEKKGSTP